MITKSRCYSSFTAQIRIFQDGDMAFCRWFNIVENMTELARDLEKYQYGTCCTRKHKIRS